MTAVQVDVPATMYSLYRRPSAEARLLALTICDDVERAAAWRLLEQPGLGVRLAIGDEVLLELLVGESRLHSWLLWANLKGVRSPDGVEAQI